MTSDDSTDDSTDGRRLVAVAVLTVPEADAELAADVLWQTGTGGVEERSATGQGEVGAVVEVRAPVAEASVRLEAALADACRRRRGWGWAIEHEADAAPELWRDHVAPMPIDDGLTIVPAWLDPSGIETVVVRIEPAGSFGLGDHPTTRSCLATVARRCRGTDGGDPPTSVLDVGCGSGVLGIVAAKLCGAAVRAVDVDSLAVSATRHNAVLNDVDALVEVDDADLGTIDGPFELVVANILAPVLIELAPKLRRLTAPSGRLVISGVLTEAHQHVLDALAPMRVVAAEDDAGWAVVTLAPPGV